MLETSVWKSEEKGIARIGTEGKEEQLDGE